MGWVYENKNVVRVKKKINVCVLSIYFFELYDAIIDKAISWMTDRLHSQFSTNATPTINSTTIIILIIIAHHLFSVFFKYINNTDIYTVYVTQILLYIYIVELKKKGCKVL